MHPQRGAATFVWMRRSPRLALPLLLLTGCCVPSTGCHKTHTDSGRRPHAKAGKRQPKRVVLPAPLPLPDQPDAATWIAEPGRAVAMLAPYSPVALDLAVLAERAIAQVTEADVATQLAATIDIQAPFANVVLADGEEVIRLSIDPGARNDLAATLAHLEPAGEFGAVHLPPTQAGGSSTWMAWVDTEDGGALVLAKSLPGLVTGRELEAHYGERPVFFSVDPQSLPLPAEVLEQLPFSRVEGRGNLHKLTILADALPGRDPLADIPLVPGTLGGLLDGPDLSAGVSGRYADYKAAVRDVIGEVNRQVAGLPFLVRGVGEGLAAKLNATLRTWDGRVLVALGPSGHLRIAYGASDVSKSRVATIRLLQAVVDNVSVARSFVSNLPRLNFRRRVATGDGNELELLVVHDAKRNVPVELRALIDDQDRLNVAIGWSHRVGGGAIVVGPNADDALARWLDETKDSASGEQTSEQLLSGMLAVEPQALRTLLGPEPTLELATLLGLATTGPRWSVQVRKLEGERYEIGIETPEKPARAR